MKKMLLVAALLSVAGVAVHATPKAPPRALPEVKLPSQLRAGKLHGWKIVMRTANEFATCTNPYVNDDSMEILCTIEKLEPLYPGQK